ncbi:hypothetical protein D3C87_964890 [compost metagenome]
MHHQHGNRNEAAQQGERVEQREEAAVVEDVHVRRETERHALQHVANRHAADQGRHEAAHEQGRIPAGAPARIFALAAEFERHGTHDQRHEDDEHGQVKARERNGVQLRPGGKDGAAAEDQPHLVAFPHGADTVDDDSALEVRLAGERQQDARAQVEAVRDGKAHQQDADQQPPYQAQGFIRNHFMQNHGLVLLRRVEYEWLRPLARGPAPSLPAPCGWP